MSANILDKFTNTTTAVGTRPKTTSVATIRSSGGTTLSCEDLAGWPTATAVHFVTYETDGNGDVVSGSQSDWKGIVSGTDINSLTLTGGTDNGNSVGDIVEMLPTAAWGKDMIDGLLATHNQLDGSLKDSIVTTAKINDSAVTSAKLASSSVTSAKMSLTKSTDANGWSVYDYGSWKEYVKTFGPYSTTSLASLGVATLGSDGNFPVGVVPNTVQMTYVNSSIASASNRYFIAPIVDITASSITTFDINARNITSSTLSTSGLYLTVRLKEK